MKRKSAGRPTTLLLLTAVLLAGCSPKPALKAIKAARTTVESTVTTTSSGTVDAEQQAALGFSAPGRVARIAVQVGAHVRRGQVLASLENTDLRTIFEDAEREAKRADELFAAGLVAKVAQDEARKNLEVARSNLDRTLITAPFDGVVTEQNLQLGELAQAAAAAPGAQTPIRLIDQKPRRVKGNIDEVDLARVHVGSVARVKIQAVRQAPFRAVVDRVVPYVSTTKEQDRTSQIELKITDAEELVPVGASADVEIVTDSRSGVLAVPARVVLGHGAARYLFRYEDGKIHKTPVQIGLGNYDRTEIVSGLKEGDVAVYPPEDIELADGLRVKAEIAPWP